MINYILYTLLLAFEANKIATKLKGNIKCLIGKGYVLNISSKNSHNNGPNSRL
jgi:uncharacterized membrane protein (DUF485 family)